MEGVTVVARVQVLQRKINPHFLFLASPSLALRLLPKVLVYAVCGLRLCLIFFGCTRIISE